MYVIRRARGTAAGDGSGGVRGGERRDGGGLPLRLAGRPARAAVCCALGARTRAQALATQEDAA